MPPTPSASRHEGRLPNVLDQQTAAPPGSGGRRGAAGTQRCPRDDETGTRGALATTARRRRSQTRVTGGGTATARQGARAGAHAADGLPAPTEAQRARASSAYE